MVEEHTIRIWFRPDLEKLRRGSDLDGKPSHWPGNSNLEVEEDVWQTWLPDDWGQGTLTQPSAVKPCYISPEGKICMSKTVVEKEVGTELVDHLEEMPKIWPNWLPNDYGITYKINLHGKREKIFVHPNLTRSFLSKADVEKFLASPNPRSLINLRLGPGALPDKDVASTTQEPVLKRAKVSSTDSEVEEVGSDDKAEHDYGYLMRPFRRSTSWLLLPDDVESITLHLFNDRLEGAGWKCIRQKDKCFVYESTIGNMRMEISLYSARGRLLVRTTDRSVALDVANTYMDLLFTE